MGRAARARALAFGGGPCRRAPRPLREVAGDAWRPSLAGWGVSVWTLWGRGRLSADGYYFYSLTTLS